ncbi:hypothetical protein GDO81_016492 [Engystomops pustulosus]|uniref:Uncharacterized protein n=1 Tax=Engystomops pustulosus TaxID=76066 RepID=A0AAV7AWZ4_ENGPU|nr:hypothetical protein GDO81_016492 [Engystomops pustulosus]
MEHRSCGTGAGPAISPAAPSARLTVPPDGVFGIGDLWPSEKNHCLLQLVKSFLHMAKKRQKIPHGSIIRHPAASNSMLQI